MERGLSGAPDEPATVPVAGAGAAALGSDPAVLGASSGCASGGAAGLLAGLGVVTAKAARRRRAAE